MASPRLNAAGQQVNCDESQVNAASPRLNAAGQQVNSDGSQVNVASPRLKAAEQQVNCDDSQVKSCVAAVKGDGLEGNQSQGDDSPATPLRLTAAKLLPAHPLTSHRSNRSPLTAPAVAGHARATKSAYSKTFTCVRLQIIEV